MTIKDFPKAKSIDEVREHFAKGSYFNVGIERVSDDDFDVYESFSSFEESLYDEFGDEIFEDGVYLIDDRKLNPEYYNQHKEFLDELATEINIEEANNEA